MKIIRIFALWILGTAAVFAQDKPIETSELPKESQVFLNTHFKDNAVHHAVQENDKGKVSYEVMLVDGTEVEFTSKGAWKEVDGKKKAIPTAYILAPILEYVKKNYPNQQITHIDKGLRDIDVDLSDGTELEFDLKGKFLRIDR